MSYPQHPHHRGAPNKDPRNWTHCFCTGFATVIAIAGGNKAILKFGSFDRPLATVLNDVVVQTDIKTPARDGHPPREFRHAALREEHHLAHVVQFDPTETVPGLFKKDDKIAVFLRLELPRNDKNELDLNAKCVQPISWAFAEDYEATEVSSKAVREALRNQENLLKEQSGWTVHLCAPSLNLDVYDIPQAIANMLAIDGHEIVDGVWKNSPADVLWEVLDEISGGFVIADGDEGKGHKSPPFLKPNQFVVNNRRPSGGINPTAQAFEAAKSATAPATSQAETPAEPQAPAEGKIVEMTAAPKAPKGLGGKKAKTPPPPQSPSDVAAAS